MARATMMFDLEDLNNGVPGVERMNTFGVKKAGPNQAGIVVKFREGLDFLRVLVSEPR